ncbi:hypothetical protein M405DRAFT_323648 [Rhizopogon salebrosus TDB-379]|nr:hypothetical protein M405DRAFT_323648 [Rhizopogon salebrosus TDB-379]
MLFFCHQIYGVFFSMFLRLCASTVRGCDPQFHALSCTTSICRVLWLSIMGRSLSPLPALCAFPPWMVGTSLGSPFVLRIWTDATPSLGTIGSLLSVQRMLPLSFCGLLRRRSIGYLLTIVGCFIGRVGIFLKRIGHHCLCLIFTEDVESVKSRVVSVVNDPDMNEIATQAGFLNASQAGPYNVENVDFDNAPPRQR